MTNNPFLNFLITIIALILAVEALILPSVYMTSYYKPELYPRVDASTGENIEWQQEYYVTHVAEIAVKDYGRIRLGLCGIDAPLTVKNFISHAQDGFYDGLTFHRIMEGFMIQGGDPEGTGNGDSGRYVIGEFADNGFDNPLPHRRGVISMARSLYSYDDIEAEDSASCQFFIMHETDKELDGQFAAFGFVQDGMAVVDAIVEASVNAGYTEYVQPQDQPVIESVTISETPYTPTHYATVNFDDYSPIRMVLFGNAAPNVVSNFIEAAELGVYEGRTVHRAEAGYWVAGSAYADGASDGFLPVNEFSGDGMDNPIQHRRRVVTMDGVPGKYTDNAQFVVLLEDDFSRDGNYSAFGYVVDGIRTMDYISSSVDPETVDENGNIFTYAQPTIYNITIEPY